MNPQIGERRGRGWPPSNTPPHACYPTEFGSFRSDEIRLKNLNPRDLPFKVSQVIGTGTDWSAIYDFLLTSHSNHSAPAEGVPLGITYRRSGWKNKIEWWGYRAEKKVWQYLDTIHECLISCDLFLVQLFHSCCQRSDIGLQGSDVTSVVGDLIASRLELVSLLIGTCRRRTVRWICMKM